MRVGTVPLGARTRRPRSQGSPPALPVLAALFALFGLVPLPVRAAAGPEGSVVLTAAAVALVLLAAALVVSVVRRRRAERAVEHGRAFLQSVLDGLPEPVFVLGPDHAVLLRNRRAQELEGEPSEAPEDGPRAPFFHPPGSPCGADGEPCVVREVTDALRPVRFERRRGREGEPPETYEVSAAPLLRNGSLAGVVAAAHDVSELKSVHRQLLDRERELEHMAQHDPLTGLPNRLLFVDRLRQAIARSRRSRRTVALLYLDLDRFKTINDTMGHETGDLLLAQVADRLKASVRDEDTVARLGGDEFTVLIEESLEKPSGAGVARKILQALERPFPVGAAQLRTGASIGIAIFPTDGTTVDHLMRNADAAMYLAKERGRGNYQFFTESLNEKARRQLLLEARLGEAVAEGGIDLHFQPIVRLRDGRIAGAEALLRWSPPGLGPVRPGEFIPVAEETGLIVPMGEAVLREACRAAARWRAAGFPWMRVAVNVSARQLWHHDLEGSVRGALEESGLPPSSLQLELTEGLLRKGDDATAPLRTLRALGVHLALDDFGIAPSSLASLRAYPFDELKMAQDLVREIPSDPSGSAVVEAILSLGRSLGFEMTAEGVERLEQAEFFRARGCDLAQGFHFGRPVPGDELDRLLLGGTAGQGPAAPDDLPPQA